MKKLLLLLSLLLFTCSLFAQTAARLEWLLEQSHINHAQAALFVLEAADHINPAQGLSPEAAFSFAQEQGFLPGNVDANDAVIMKDLSLLVMRSFDIKGGFFYTISKSRHHAYRELVHRGIIQGRADPLMHVTGDLLMFVVSRTLHFTETGQL